MAAVAVSRRLLRRHRALAGRGDDLGAIRAGDRPLRVEVPRRVRRQRQHPPVGAGDDHLRAARRRSAVAEIRLVQGRVDRARDREPRPLVAGRVALDTGHPRIHLRRLFVAPSPGRAARAGRRAAAAARIAGRDPVGDHRDLGGGRRRRRGRRHRAGGGLHARPARPRRSPATDPCATAP